MVKIMNSIGSTSIDALVRTALTIRQRTIKTSASARIPHLGSCLSCVDILIALYWYELRINPKTPETSDRDRFVLSKAMQPLCSFKCLRNVAPS